VTITPDHDPGATAATRADHRRELARAYDQTVAVLGLVAPPDLGRPTPCTEFDVAALGGHIVFASGRLAMFGRGEPAPDEPSVPTPMADWVPAVADAAADVATVWADSALLDREIVVPWGSYPGTAMVDMYMIELVAHSWDLATAIGATGGLDDGLAAVALEVAGQIIPPDFRGGEMPFGPVVAVADDAAPYARFAGFMGRRP
jgi:uncharacterized protein (TIGR03086 family)